MALVNRILSLTQADLPAPQGTTRQAGDYLENPEMLKQVQHNKVKEPVLNLFQEYEHQIDHVRSGTSCYDTSNGVDQMIYKLYGLTEEEIKIVEK